MFDLTVLYSLILTFIFNSNRKCESKDPLVPPKFVALFKTSLSGLMGTNDLRPHMIDRAFWVRWPKKWLETKRYEKQRKQKDASKPVDRKEKASKDQVVAKSLLKVDKSKSKAEPKMSQAVAKSKADSKMGPAATKLAVLEQFEKALESNGITYEIRKKTG